jgi:hypothetical protein
MFQLSIIDHIRLSFGTVVGAYQGHTAAAARLAEWGWYANVTTLTVLGLATAAELLGLRYGGPLQITGAVLTAIAFCVFASYVAFDPAPRIYGHRASAARLWVLCEKYRALLSEVQDGLIDVPAVTHRRDALLREFGTLFEQTAPADRYTHEIAQKALSGSQLGGYTDQELDQFLPPALRRSGRPPVEAPAAS